MLDPSLERPGLPVQEREIHTMLVTNKIVDGRLYVLWDEVKDEFEAGRTKSESGTAGCSDAGGGDTPSKTGRSADWQACFNEVMQLAEKEIAFRKAGMDDEPGGFTAGCWTQAVCFKRALERVAEERRRSEERT